MYNLAFIVNKHVGNLSDLIVDGDVEDVVRGALAVEEAGHAEISGDGVEAEGRY